MPSEGIRLRSVNRYKTVSNTPNAPITMPTANAAATAIAVIVQLGADIEESS